MRVSRMLAVTAAAVSATMSVAHAGDLPFPTTINGKKVVTLISRDPPGVRCNTNIQVAAELQNRFKVPFIVIPMSVLGPNAKAPAVYYGDELIAVDGGNANGMISATELGDVLDIEGAENQPEQGRLTQIKDKHEEFKRAIKDVK